MGAECMYQCGGHVPGGQIAVMSIAARINGNLLSYVFLFCLISKILLSINVCIRRDKTANSMLHVYNVGS